MLTKDEAREFVSGNIHARLAVLNWNVEKLSEMLDGIVPRNTVYRIARGENVGSLHHVTAVAETLGISLDDLVQKPKRKYKNKDRSVA